MTERYNPMDDPELSEAMELPTDEQATEKARTRKVNAAYEHADEAFDPCVVGDDVPKSPSIPKPDLTDAVQKVQIDRQFDLNTEFMDLVINEGMAPEAALMDKIFDTRILNLETHKPETVIHVPSGYEGVIQSMRKEIINEIKADILKQFNIPGLTKSAAPAPAPTNPFQMEKTFAIMKVDATHHTVSGLVTSEAIDKDGEVCDYASAKAAYQKWSKEAMESTMKAGQQISMGNIRYMHKGELAGKVTGITFDDERKQIYLETQPVNDEVWRQIEEGFIRGFSQGGKYAFRKCAACGTEMAGKMCKSCQKEVYVRYGPVVSEVSYVDNPCLTEATFSYVKADGSMEIRKFKKV